MGVSQQFKLYVINRIGKKKIREDWVKILQQLTFNWNGMKVFFLLSAENETETVLK